MKFNITRDIGILCAVVFILGIILGVFANKINSEISFIPKVDQIENTSYLYPNTEKEPNNTFDQANLLIPGYETIGTLANVKDVDVYKFKIDNPANIKISLKNSPNKYSMFVYNENKEAIAFSNRSGFRASTSVVSLPDSGTYYIKIASASDSANTIKALYTITLDILPFLE